MSFDATPANFESIRNCFLSGEARFLAFDAAMTTGQEASVETIDWYVEVDHGRYDAPAREPLRLRRREEAANSLGLIITTSLLFVLLAAAVTFGGHAAISPLLSQVVAARDAKGSPFTGSIVFTMPDGVFCRYMSFDNTNGEVAGAAIRQCPDQIAEGAAANASGFKWDAP